MTNDLTLCVMDIRRSPTQAPLVHRSNAVTGEVKTVSLKLYTGDLWVQNPNSHVYIMMDGWIDSTEPQRSLKGRGICLGHVPTGTGISFEHFGEPGFMVGDVDFMPFLPNEFYDIKIACDSKRITYMLSGASSVATGERYFSKNYPAFDTVIGVAGDRNSSTYGFFNVKQSMGKYFTSRELSL